jgi:hypothetical protein
MDTKDVSALLLRTIGLVMVAYSVFEIPLYFIPNAGGSDQFSFLAVFAQAAAALTLPIVLGLLLWFFPATITNKIVSGAKLSGDRFGAADLERVALTVVGLWLIAYGIADLIYSFSLLIFTQREYAERSPPLTRYLPGIVTSAAKVVIGAGIAVGAKGIARVLTRARGEAE